MPEIRSRLGLRLVAEFLVIVTGVLAALGVDEWREERQKQELGRELMRSFIFDLRNDSADFADLSPRALERARGAEILQRNLAPDAPRIRRAQAALDSLGPYPERATDEELGRAFADLTSLTDFDVALGAYQNFSENGGQRLIVDVELRQEIHAHYYFFDRVGKLDPRVSDAREAVGREAVSLGLALVDDDAAHLREVLSTERAASFFAAVRELQWMSLIQARVARNLERSATRLIARLRTELES